MYTPRKQTLPPRKRKLAPAFGEEESMPPPPPKRARADDIVEDDDTSDDEPPSTFEVGGTSQPPLHVTTDVEPEDVDPPTLVVRCEMYDHPLEALRGVVHAIQEAQYMDDQARHILHNQVVRTEQMAGVTEARSIALRDCVELFGVPVAVSTNSGAGGGGTNGNINSSGNENGGGIGNGTCNSSGAGGSETKGEDTNCN
ncbi:hypothetical protein L1987_13365 [Smallanthus sonchifolius]|uniref:Uncharacterized protein n=1 Tax=Smallanthus sonchifolius TaxID=185202 RepID=A0ACB9JGV3_9ASTR|nr:hypothetical protein L1987_13365 [Smallanthus sonchifolius]